MNFLKEDIRIDGDQIKTDIRQDNLEHMALAAFLRTLPPEQRKFFKECRVVSVVPIYLPDGAFKPNETALTLDPDQLDWAVEKFPEFSTVDKTRNVSGVTGQKLMKGYDG